MNQKPPKPQSHLLLPQRRADAALEADKDFDVRDVGALQALARGEAEAHQQKRALGLIVERITAMYERQYHPTDRDTAFALGRAFVGQQIVGLLKIDVSKMRKMT